MEPLNNIIFSPDFLARLQEPILLDGRYIEVKLETPAPDETLDPHSVYLSLAKKVISIFGPFLSKEKVDEKMLQTTREFILEWSKPWRLRWLEDLLAIDQKKVKIELIFRGELQLQADTAEELQRAKDDCRKRLALVNPPVDLSLLGITETSSHFKTISDIETGVKSGALRAIEAKIVPIDEHIKQKSGHCVSPKLAAAIEEFFINSIKIPKNKDFLKDIIMISGTRDLMTQKLLQDMGYPAASISYHTLGQAVDFRLNEAAKINLREYLAKDNRLKKIDKLVSEGHTSTIDNLIRADIIELQSPLGNIQNLLSNVPSCRTLDETPFFRVIDPVSQSTLMLHPVWHVQTAI